MIQNSFIFLDRVTHNTEKKIWEAGVHSWDAFLKTKSLPGIRSARKTLYNLQIEKAYKNLEVQNFDYFASVFPRSDHWRLYGLLKDDIIYLDIETTHRHDITVIGVYDGENTRTLVKNRNLDKRLFQRIIAGKKGLVTFNGSSFDIPIIERYFGIKLNMPHIDLRHVCAKIGLTGGLKRIEQEVGIGRDSGDLGGQDAIRLWKMYQITGNDKYLEQLISYNLDDTTNLEHLAKIAIPKMWQNIAPKIIKEPF